MNRLENYLFKRIESFAFNENPRAITLGTELFLLPLYIFVMLKYKLKL